MLEALLGTPTSVPVDQPDGFTSLLIHGDGSLVDTYGHPMSGNSAVYSSSSSQSKFGSRSILFAGSNAAVTTPDAPDLRFDGDCTMEAWLYLNSITTDNVFLEKSPDTNQVNRCWVEFYQRKIYLKLTGNSGQAALLVGDILVTGQWFHFAVTRSGNTWTAWYNGSNVGAITAAQSFGVNAGQLIIGNVQGLTSNFPGYMNEIRLTRGKARYTQSFAPPNKPFAY